MNTKPFITVAGNIGAGKSTLAKMLGEYFGWEVQYEHVDGNPYLSRFYEDMNRWSFHLQVYFLSKRFKDHQNVMNLPGGVIQDRSIYEDAGIFARNLHATGRLSQCDYENYAELYSCMIGHLAPPDLMIFLDAGVETVMKHITARGRPCERSISREYLEQLGALYAEWIGSFRLCPVLTIPCDGMDFVNDRSAFNRVAFQVNNYLWMMAPGHGMAM